MNYVDKMLKLQELVKRIKKGGTGTQATLSQELRTNLATLNRQFDMLRDMEADLRFDRIKNTYYFNNSFDLTDNVTKE